jgi:hypothetical protein
MFAVFNLSHDTVYDDSWEWRIGRMVISVLIFKERNS